MEEGDKVIRPAADALSIAEMQQKPVHQRKDIKTTNPRRLFRDLKNTLEDLGYTITYNPINIQKDAVGDTGFVEAAITGKKEALISSKTGGWIEYFMIIVGIIIFSFAVWILFSTGSDSGLVGIIGFIAIFGLIVAIFGVLSSKRKKLPEPEDEHNAYLNKIWIKGEGEIYGGQLSESRSNREMQQEQIISELSVSIAGESKKHIYIDGVRQDVEQLTRKLEALSE